MPERDNYKRFVHADGTLLGEEPKSGTGVARSFGHYATEYWMQDGERMGYIKMYDGPLLAMVKFVYKDKYMSKKKYHALCDQNSEMPRFDTEDDYNYLTKELKEERIRKKQRVKVTEKPSDPESRKKLESFCQKLMRGDRCKE